MSLLALRQPLFEECKKLIPRNFDGIISERQMTFRPVERGFAEQEASIRGNRSDPRLRQWRQRQAPAAVSDRRDQVSPG